MFLRQKISSLLHLLLKDTSVKVLSGPLQGWKWLPRSGNHAYWLGTYEREYVNTFAQYVRPGSIIFDIGAQAGYFTLIASRLTGRDGRVVTFEPLPENVFCIREHCRLNNCKNVEILEVAVASSSGRRTFQADNVFMGYLSKEGSLEVEVVVLDELAEQNQILPPNVMKIDVEGMEYWVLRGGENLIRTSRPEIFIATHGQENQTRVLRLLQEWSYEVSMIGRGSERNADYLAKPLSIV
ncbi:MAG: FkbM family methyltransferase [Cyanobacteria bacterium SID2]|nr:FkbM family methyltransferase [Cyanobacteria bacterium SID2]MBP0006284.1 FkbM family methyltransferase [Cyanobacteria bacterium SBC]